MGLKVLAGDIGGTSARMAYFDVQDERVEVISQHVYQSAQFSGFSELVGEFVSSRSEAAEAACFSIAGAVRAQPDMR